MHDLENICKKCSTKISLKLSQINLLKYIAINMCTVICSVKLEDLFDYVKNLN